MHESTKDMQSSSSNWKELIRLASCQMDQGEYSSSLSLYSRALSLIEQSRGKDDLQLCLPLVRIGRLYQLKGKPHVAERMFKRSAEILTGHLEKHKPEDGLSHLLGD